jgi:phytanoyl-CoA hydroxylase
MAVSVVSSDPGQNPDMGARDGAGRARGTTIERAAGGVTAGAVRPFWPQSMQVCPGLIDPPRLSPPLKSLDQGFIHTAATDETVMWAEPGNGLNMRTLWTDTPYAVQRVAGLSEAGEITAGERDDLIHFIDHGWLVWPAAIDPDLIDRFADAIHNHHRHPGKFLTTNHRQGQSGRKLSGTTPERFESLFDLYVNMDIAREVSLHPRICRFLSLIFDTQPVICQQLLFQRSNGHRVHQDTSVVTIEDPMLMTASWIALEDVVEGSGELGFYDRSHRLPHYIFKDGTKRMQFGDDDQDLYVNELDAACRREGMTYERFLARKGDVFFWTADLVHRSHPRTLPEDASRLSCVTHYHPTTTTPFWFRHHPNRTRMLDYGDRGSYVSAHYSLAPKQRGMIDVDSPFMG